MVLPQSQPSGPTPPVEPQAPAEDIPAVEAQDAPPPRPTGPVQVAPPEGAPHGRAAINELWLGVGILMVVTITAGLLLMRYRRSVLTARAGDGEEGIMQMLRSARDRGEMTEEEFQAARRTIVESMKARIGARAEKPEGKT